MKAVPSFKLTQEGSDIIVNTAIEKAKELKQIVSIAVVDAGGHLFAFKRMTNGRTIIRSWHSRPWRGANHGRHRKPIAKARKSLDHQVLAQTLGVGPGWFISIEGGIPITLEGQCIGAVGVSGAPSAVDRQIGQAESMRLPKPSALHPAKFEDSAVLRKGRHPAEAGVSPGMKSLN